MTGQEPMYKGTKYNVLNTKVYMITESITNNCLFTISSSEATQTQRQIAPEMVIPIASAAPTADAITVTTAKPTERLIGELTGMVYFTKNLFTAMTMIAIVQMIQTFVKRWFVKAFSPKPKRPFITIDTMAEIPNIARKVTISIAITVGFFTIRHSFLKFYF